MVKKQERHAIEYYMQSKLKENIKTTVPHSIVLQPQLKPNYCNSSPDKSYPYVTLNKITKLR